MGKVNRIDYTSYEGQVRKSNKYGEYEIQSYSGMESKTKTHFFTIRFIDTGNVEEAVSWKKIKSGAITDSRLVDLQKKIKKSEVVRQRNMVAKGQMKEKKVKRYPIARDKMVVLALDLSTNSTGYALFKDTTIVDFGSITYGENKQLSLKDKNTLKEIPSTTLFGIGEKDMWLDNRLKNMYQFIIKLINQHHPQLVVIEDCYLMNVNVLKTLMLLQGYIRGVCLNKDIPCELLMPSSWQNYFNMEHKREKIKERSKEIAKATVKQEVWEDTADALCLGMYAVATLDSGVK
ncbi:MAG: hypothetical protein BV458_03475 [Thermoplasmata archaeon M9B2D]|nr:MAG: hypothetical protein BV458_03475 [Thermoplasmata archaeon M9B2D]